jgi:hypothetical protein
MDPLTVHGFPSDWRHAHIDVDVPGSRGIESAGKPEAFVLFEHGAIEGRIVHDAERVERRRDERALEALAQSYARYARWPTWTDSGGDSPRLEASPRDARSPAVTASFCLK